MRPGRWSVFHCLNFDKSCDTAPRSSLLKKHLTHCHFVLNSVSSLSFRSYLGLSFNIGYIVDISSDTHLHVKLFRLFVLQLKSKCYDLKEIRLSNNWKSLVWLTYHTEPRKDRDIKHNSCFSSRKVPYALREFAHICQQKNPSILSVNCVVFTQLLRAHTKIK